MKRLPANDAPSTEAQTEPDPAEPESSLPMISVEVVYALRERQRLLRVKVPTGTTAAEAIELSGIREMFAGIPKQPTLGIFSRKVAPEEVLRAGDRVEIYRPLVADPKEVRRARAAANNS